MLRRAIAMNRVAQAYLFVGPDGVGKRLVALNFAKALNCAKSKSEPCDECPACKRINGGNHIDVQVFVPKGLSRQLKVEQVKQFIDQVNLKPYESNWKVFILCDADRANAASQNKILKVLEEPPDETVIVLTTSNPDGVLPTIRSRCQIVNFSSLPPEEIEKLITGDGTTPEQAHLAAMLSQGQMGKALQWLDGERLAQREAVFNLLTSEKRIPVESIVFVATELEGYLRKKRDRLIAEELDEAKKDANWPNIDASGRADIEDTIKADAEGRFRQEASEILNYLASLYRDMLVLKEARREDLLINRDMIDRISPAAEKRTYDDVMRTFREIDYARESIARNVKISNCLEALLLRLTYRENTGVRI